MNDYTTVPLSEILAKCPTCRGKGALGVVRANRRWTTRACPSCSWLRRETNVPDVTAATLEWYHEADIALIESVTRQADALADAAKALDELDWCIGYELLTHQHEQLDKARELARAALRGRRAR